jgi:hypothetical protein
MFDLNKLPNETRIVICPICGGYNPIEWQRRLNDLR